MQGGGCVARPRPKFTNGTTAIASSRKPALSLKINKSTRGARSYIGFAWPLPAVRREAHAHYFRPEGDTT
jgi:hypothetical protein